MFKMIASERQKYFSLLFVNHANVVQFAQPDGTSQSFRLFRDLIHRLNFSIFIFLKRLCKSNLELIRRFYNNYTRYCFAKHVSQRLKLYITALQEKLTKACYIQRWPQRRGVIG